MSDKHNIPDLLLRLAPLLWHNLLASPIGTMQHYTAQHNTSMSDNQARQPPCTWHSLQALGGRERYIFFSFPHIAIDAKGTVGHISRPGRPGVSCACGAVAKALGDIKRDGLVSSCKPPGGESAHPQACACKPSF